MKTRIPIHLSTIALVSVLLASCENRIPPGEVASSPGVVTAAEPATSDETSSILDLPCLAPCSSSSAPKAFGDTKYFWKKSERMNLTVSFQGGTPGLQKRVAKIANKWITEGGAGVNFNFVREGRGVIRIAFGKSGHWSRVGRSARDANQSDPTMNLMVTDSTNEDELQRVTLHEFGHALGLMHEHRQPGNPIIWNKPVVLAYYKKPPNNWDSAMVEAQVFKPYESPTSISNGYHPDSIMHYPILEGWSKNSPPIIVGWNRDLSQSDKDFISGPDVYPKL